MNKQEAIERIENSYTLTIQDNRSDESLVMLIKADVIDILNQIDTQPKVVVPKFVAEWIEAVKSVDWTLKSALTNTSDEVRAWLADKDNQEIFAQAWIFGYEVEQEQLYTVEIPDPNSYCDYRYLSRNDNGICLDASNDTKWKHKKRNQFTESEIKQDFAWAWQFAKPVEVE